MAAPPVDQARIAEDAAEVAKRLFHSAASFQPSDASLSLADRLAMSPAQHCAWAIRFDPANSDPKGIMALHGFS